MIRATAIIVALLAAASVFEAMRNASPYTGWLVTLAYLGGTLTGILISVWWAARPAPKAKWTP